ncbi:SRPBCC family protein [Fictibacillus phosphorivorans]|uniref:SRPBCC family protein n=1 Tax=Fictibacillus phosphorivorans TaxID=1221500 RepID=UPI0012936457|nr:SRPBCC family protein [Fictibacillus phosphorivorans]MQR94528.1 polyketide cyclase [Fictibacillus phosphorivorans]
METSNKVMITVETTVHKPIAEVWKYWTEPQHITGWSFASDEWHAPKAENDLREGGRFLTRMEAKDGSFGFDFSGAYDEVKTNEYIAYTLDDGRKVTITFVGLENETRIVETFEAESSNPVEMQEAGWQAFMDNFKRYSESQN